MSQLNHIKIHMRNEDDKTFCGRTIVDYWQPIRMSVPKAHVIEVPRQGKRWPNRRYVSCRVCIEHRYDPIIQERVNQMCQVCNQFGRHDQQIAHPEKIK